MNLKEKNNLNNLLNTQYSLQYTAKIYCIVKYFPKRLLLNAYNNEKYIDINSSTYLLIFCTNYNCKKKN